MLANLNGNSLLAWYGNANVVVFGDLFGDVVVNSHVVGSATSLWNVDRIGNFSALLLGFAANLVHRARTLFGGVG